MFNKLFEKLTSMNKGPYLNMKPGDILWIKDHHETIVYRGATVPNQESFDNYPDGLINATITAYNNAFKSTKVKNDAKRAAMVDGDFDPLIEGGASANEEPGTI